MRLPKVRKNRQCIRPEISRTYTFNQDGTSKGEYGEFLKNILLSNYDINWMKINLSYLLHVKIITSKKEKL
jgi:hypothetical protein